LIIQFYDDLRAGSADIVFGYRTKRSVVVERVIRHPVLGNLSALCGQKCPGKWISSVALAESETVSFRCGSELKSYGTLFWVGFRRRYVGYERQPARKGKSAWTLPLKLRYCLDSIFNFTDLPIRILLALGVLGTVTAIVLGSLIVTLRLTNGIPVAGYTALALMILFFGSLMTLGMGIVGQYVWLCLQNARRRPNYLIDSIRVFDERSHPQAYGQP
jgi:hypothetical protein